MSHDKPNRTSQEHRPPNGSEVRYCQLYSKERLRRAARFVLNSRHKDALGADGQTAEEFWPHFDEEIESLHSQLYSRQYVPGGIHNYTTLINGKRRTLFVLNIRDAIVERALKDLIEPLFEPHFHPQSFGYRPGRSIAELAVNVQEAIETGNHAFHRADFEDCFLNIDCKHLLQLVARRVDDWRILALLSSILFQHSSDLWRQATNGPKTKGVLLGSPLSPLLCNIYLSPLDAMLGEAEATFFRYADDLLILDSDLKLVYDRVNSVEAFLAGNYPGNFRLNGLKNNFGWAVDDPSRQTYWGPLQFVGLTFAPGRFPAITGKKLGNILVDLAKGGFKWQNYNGTRKSYLALGFPPVEQEISAIDALILETAHQVSGCVPSSLKEALGICAAHIKEARITLLEAASGRVVTRVRDTAILTPTALLPATATPPQEHKSIRLDLPTEGDGLSTHESGPTWVHISPSGAGDSGLRSDYVPAELDT